MKIQGGLGNQLFQYAMGRAIQEKTKSEILVLDTSDFKYDEKRNFSLDNYILSKDAKFIIDGSGKYNKFYDHRKHYYLSIALAFPRFTFNLLRIFGVYKWDVASYKEIKLKKRKNLYFHGYWQSRKYFDDIRDKLIRELTPKNLSPSIKEFAEEISKQNSVCVHIRRGDYVKMNFPLCTLAYYSSAMNIIDVKVKDPVYYIFSDDIDYVKNSGEYNFGNQKVVYVEEPHSDYEELYLMQNCHHFIIANSTFSWWASYLSHGNDKVIIAPKIWYKDAKFNLSDLPSGLIVLDN